MSRTGTDRRPSARRRTAIQVKRLTPDINTGLTSAQVERRVEEGAVNARREQGTSSVSKILVKNIFTLFNIINFALAAIVIFIGHPENALFLGIALCNTLMGIIQELRAKRTLDKLSVLAAAKANVLRDGKVTRILQQEVVLDDIIVLKAGAQVCADSVIVSSEGIEADESLLTGETDRIRKEVGDTVLSGSYITSGQAYAQVMAVGDDNYANSITSEAQKSKKTKSKLLRTINMIIRVLTIVIIPLGIMLFISSHFRHGEPIDTAILGTTSSITGMIPSGLVLLTGITMTVSAMNLARNRALVQSLPSIETLARVDTLCLDKTGTITDGTLIYEDILVEKGATESRSRQAISEIMGALNDQNSTAKALREEFGSSTSWRKTATMPFSSDRKWSGANFSGIGTYVIGAPNILFPGKKSGILDEVDKYAEKGLRVICLGFTEWQLTQGVKPEGLRCEAIVILNDNIRRDARDTFDYFEKEGVELKVISGDNPVTVSVVAGRAGITGSEMAIDMSRVEKGTDLRKLVERYTVFGHVTPQQKKELIHAMQANGRTTCMTGDGVNDILAMRESDCGVAMVSGSDAARSACDFVLMSSDFSSMINVLKEGRRVINNIERVSALFLVNVIYSVLLTLIYIFLPFSYPYHPIQMSITGWLVVGLPSFFLALQSNYAKPEGRFSANILEHSVPAALTIVFNTLYIQLAGYCFNIPTTETSTMTVFLIGVVGFFLLFRISRPYTRPIKAMLALLIVGFVTLFFVVGDSFQLVSLINKNAFFYVPLLYFSFHIHGFLGRVCTKALELIQERKRKRSIYKKNLKSYDLGTH